MCSVSVPGQNWGQVRIGARSELGTGQNWGQVRIGSRSELGTDQNWGQVRIEDRIGDRSELGTGQAEEIAWCYNGGRNVAREKHSGIWIPSSFH